MRFVLLRTLLMTPWSADLVDRQRSFGNSRVRQRSLAYYLGNLFDTTRVENDRAAPVANLWARFSVPCVMRLSQAWARAVDFLALSDTPRFASWLNLPLDDVYLHVAALSAAGDRVALRRAAGNLRARWK
jgi:hypothetical protein